MEVSPFLYFAVVILLGLVWYMYHEKRNAEQAEAETRAAFNEARKRWKEERNSIVSDWKKRVKAMEEYLREQDRETLETLNNVVSGMENVSRLVSQFGETAPEWFYEFKQHFQKRTEAILNEIDQNE